MIKLNDFLPNDLSITLNKERYQKTVNRNEPTAILFLIDQSGSMERKILYKGNLVSYSEMVANLTNNSLRELISRCTKTEGMREYFDICVIGYGGISDSSVDILWENVLSGKDWVTVSELKDSAKYKEETVRKNIRGVIKIQTEKTPYWIIPKNSSKTPMGKAFDKTYDLLKNWIIEHVNSFPPVVINITDGAQTDCSFNELSDKANMIKNLHTTDGHVLLINCHISGSGESSVLFPSSNDEIPEEEYAKNLYEISSIMPKLYSEKISILKRDTDNYIDYRGFAYNAGVDVLFNLIDIGTSGATQYITK